jgi:hypothetical protein
MSNDFLKFIKNCKNAEHGIEMNDKKCSFELRNRAIDQSVADAH